MPCIYRSVRHVFLCTPERMMPPGERVRSSTAVRCVAAAALWALASMQGAQSQPASLDKQKQALDIIAYFAERLCQAVPAQGGDRNVELTGKAKAELSNVVKKIADLGLEGGVKYQTSTYQGVLQKDLAALPKGSADCKVTVWSDLKDKLLPSGNAVKPAAQGGAAIVLRSARLLKGVDSNVLLVEIIAENPTSRPVAILYVNLEALQDWGIHCSTGAPENPWNVLNLDWSKLVSSAPSEGPAVWTTSQDQRVIVDAKLKRANCGDYVHRLSLRIPVIMDAGPKSLTRVLLRINQKQL